MIIGIAGQIGAGKDEIGKIIQFLVYCDREKLALEYCTINANSQNLFCSFEVKKFAEKIKECAAIILGCSRAYLEDSDFKNKPLSADWERDVYYIETIDSNILLETCYSKKEALVSLAHFSEYYVAADVHIRKEHVVMTPRLLLQLLGTECGRNIIHPDIWCNSLLQEYDLASSYYQIDWVITDVRFPNELNGISSRQGFVIKVERENKIENKLFHSSETSLNNADFKYTLQNSGSINDLVNKVRTILESEGIISKKNERQ